MFKEHYMPKALKEDGLKAGEGLPICNDMVYSNKDAVDFPTDLLGNDSTILLIAEVKKVVIAEIGYRLLLYKNYLLCLLLEEIRAVSG